MAIALPKRKRDSSVPTDSLSDIAFLLIIFFILTTSIRRLTGFTSEMPAAQKSAQQQQTEKTPTVALTASGMKFDSQDVTVAVLREKLAALKLTLKPESERIVILETAGKVPYQEYFEVLSAISGAGGIVGILSEEGSKQAQ